jgi:uncharacterized membrane protein
MKILKIIFLVLVFVWIAISSYLTYTHFSASAIYCGPENTLSFVNSNNSWSSCDSVLQSEYSKMFWIPTAIFWIIFYISTLIIFLSFIFKKYFISNFLYKFIEKILVFFTFIWLLFSLYFTYLQFFVINSFCVYCFISACITVLLFIMSIYIFKKK